MNSFSFSSELFHKNIIKTHHQLQLRKPIIHLTADINEIIYEPN